MVDRESVITPPDHRHRHPLLSRTSAINSTAWHSSGPSRQVLRFHCGLLLLVLLLVSFMIIGITANVSPPSDDQPTAGPDGRRPSTILEQQETVENLVRQWAPLVWLAPGELFMPGNVNDFLHNVHAQKSTPAAASIIQQTADILDVSDDVLLYELDREIGVTENPAESRSYGPAPAPVTSPVDLRERRMSLSDRVIDLPIGKRSVDWYLVSNGDIDSELMNTSSFIYGKDPNSGAVPIYSMISLCDPFEHQPNSANFNEIDSVDRIDRNNYIPIWNQGFPYKFEKPVNRSQLAVMMPRHLSLRLRRETSNRRTKTTQIDNNVYKQNVTQTIQNQTKTTIKTTRINKHKISIQPEAPKKKPSRIPHFHVTYWMFYPYNQGKTICTLNLGPFGRLPIPVLFGKCLGTRRDFGSHVGDWEHMTLFFKGRNEPEEMYVSAHDAGAYYTYERLSGSFEFRRQETRKGILQHPNFPKTVRTISDHPVLFSAQGSHGLWTAPGKHRFVRVPKLVDINGFGVPWYTWKNIEFSYDRRDRQNHRGAPSSIVGPDWLQFMGKWGNPKSKCHPLKRLGLNFCEYNDGPTGIPLKEPHFFCKRPY